MDRKQLNVVEDGASKMIGLFLRPSCTNAKLRVDELRLKLSSALAFQKQVVLESLMHKEKALKN